MNRPSSLPLALLLGAMAALLVFLFGGALAWKVEDAMGAWPVAGVAGWPQFLIRLARAPAGTLAIQHHNFQTRFLLMQWLSTIGGIVAAVWSAKAQASATQDHHLRGRRYVFGVAALAAFAKVSGREVEDDGPGIRLHPSLPPLALKREARHFLVFGGVGSGKTQTILPLMRAAAERGDSLLIYDNKGDFTTKLPARVVRFKKDGKVTQKALPPLLLAPWDTRSACWEVAADISDKSAAREFSAAVVPESKSSPMWSAAARQVLTGCIIQLQTTQSGRWGFKDLAALCFRGEIEAYQETMQVYFPEGLMAVSGANVTTIGILINLQAFLSPVADLADAWPTPPAPGKGFSLRRWLQQERPLQRTVIIQGNGRFESLGSAFAKSILTLAAQTITDPSAIGESASRRLWVFLDEFPQLGEMSRVAPLLEVGRSKGVRVVLGVQDVNQLKAIYGAERAAAWQSLIANQIVAQLQPGATSKFVAEEIIGDREVERVATSRTTGTGPVGGIFTPGGTLSTNIVRETRPVLLPSQLQSELGPRKSGVDVLWLGFSDALKLTIPYTKLPDVRDAVRIADWTYSPATREQVARMIAEAEQQAAQSTPRTQPAAPVVSPVSTCEGDTTDTAYTERVERSEPVASSTPPADPSDPLSFLDGGELPDTQTHIADTDVAPENHEGDDTTEPAGTGEAPPALNLLDDDLPPPPVPAGIETEREEFTDLPPPIDLARPPAVEPIAADEGSELADKLAGGVEAHLADAVVPGVGHLLETLETLGETIETGASGPALEVLPQQPTGKKRLKKRRELISEDGHALS